ncbi:MAG: hypothetical protein NVSMB53_11210 [Gemmatimonadaceae bacterium]
MCSLKKEWRAMHRARSGAGPPSEPKIVSENMPVDRKSPRAIEQAEQGILQTEPNARFALHLKLKQKASRTQ